MITRRTVPPAAGSESPTLKFLTGTLRRTSRVCTISHSAFILISSSATSVSVFPSALSVDVGLGALEVVALADFLARLVERVVDLLEIDRSR